ncbi:YheC/YheD family endospore coat-associated protein [Paenibacillus sp. D9]|uniref:YheC/YheD family endospore coat-associated protein n=1 Tax=Paenibacillus sp. D9 TaxID=665792 RepID=UPI0006761B4E|nr:YheC/YheD family protein [Paenibacillus sp. D9]
MRGNRSSVGVLVSDIHEGEDGREQRRTFPEDSFLAALSSRAEELGVDLYVFTPGSLDPDSGILTGYVRESSGWSEKEVPWPAVIYDRCGPLVSGRIRPYRDTLSRLAALQPHVVLNGWLPGKSAQYDALRRSGAELAELVPPSRPLAGRQALCETAESFGSLFLKPDGGMQGRGVISAAPAAEGGWLVRGRDGGSRPFRSLQPDLDAAAALICRLAGRTRYVVQPCLPLCDRQGRPFDIRALVQKDGRGEWRLTGTAMRRGRPGGVASNLHGGGEAIPARDGLSMQLGLAAADRVSARIDRLALAAAEAAESSFGRFAELGLDFGVEPDGRLWLLEMNSRPGREAFAGFAGGTARTAVERPLLYARLLCEGPSPTPAGRSLIRN